MTAAGGQAGNGTPAAVPADAEATARTETAARLRTSVGRLARRIRPTRVGADLTLTEATVLASAARNGPVGLSWLAREEGMNPTMLSRVVWRLEAPGCWPGGLIRGTGGPPWSTPPPPDGGCTSGSGRSARTR